MRIIPGKRYQKSYKKLSSRHKDAVDRAIAAFEDNPNNPDLRNHALKGEFYGFRSIDAAFDLRIIFKEEDEYIVVLLFDVGTHSQLYG